MLESTFKNPWILTKKNTHKSSGKIHATSSKLLGRDTYQLLLGRKKNPAPRRVHWVGRGIPTCEHPKPETQVRNLQTSRRLFSGACHVSFRRWKFADPLFSPPANGGIFFLVKPFFTPGSPTEFHHVFIPLVAHGS